jgi:hypothetical protein
MWGMNAQMSTAALSLLLFLLLGATYILFLLWIISRISGWALLARRFRANKPFYGETWSWQSARFRLLGGYNNCLTVGANQEGISLSVMPIMFPLRLFHPALLIPWREIEVETGKMFFGLRDTARFRIGTQERVTVRIYGKLVGRMRQAAGPGWPLYAVEQMEAPSKG